jgi:hypothetical protein
MRAMKRRSVKAVKGALEAAPFPEFCDYSCPNADFAAAETVGACRREVGIFCKLLKAYVPKNGRCLARAAK